jgi:hypothetical protein
MIEHWDFLSPAPIVRPTNLIRVSRQGSGSDFWAGVYFLVGHGEVLGGGAGLVGEEPTFEEFGFGVPSFGVETEACLLLGGGQAGAETLEDELGEVVGSIGEVGGILPSLEGRKACGDDRFTGGQVFEELEGQHGLGDGDVAIGGDEDVSGSSDGGQGFVGNLW